MILDTNIVSYWVNDNPIFSAYVPHIKRTAIHSIAFITVGELYLGAEIGNWEHEEIEKMLKKFTVVPYDYQIARCFAKIVANYPPENRRKKHHDAWIAACAVRHNVPLLSHNARDFQDIPGLTLITERHPQ